MRLQRSDKKASKWRFTMKTRVTIYLLITFAMALIFYQNRDFYLSEHTISLNLFFTQFGMPPIANATQVLFFFLAGIVLTCVSFYHERFKMRREIKNLKTAFHSCAAQVTEMKPTECPRPIKKLFKLPGKSGSKKNGTGDGSPVADRSDTLPA